MKKNNTKKNNQMKNNQKKKDLNKFYNAQVYSQVCENESIIRDIQRRHFEEGLYTEEEYQTLINFYSKEKKKTRKKFKH